MAERDRLLGNMSKGLNDLMNQASMKADQQEFVDLDEKIGSK